MDLKDDFIPVKEMGWSVMSSHKALSLVSVEIWELAIVFFKAFE